MRHYKDISELIIKEEFTLKPLKAKFVVKPSNFEEIATIYYRIRASWSVFIGKCVAVQWRKQ